MLEAVIGGSSASGCFFLRKACAALSPEVSCGQGRKFSTLSKLFYLHVSFTAVLVRVHQESLPLIANLLVAECSIIVLLI
jgi:hypothetical protein